MTLRGLSANTNARRLSTSSLPPPNCIMFKFILRYLRGFKLKFFLILLCVVVTAAADLLMPYLSGKFIDEILSSREIGRLYFFIGGLLVLNVVSLTANWFYVIFSTKIRAHITNKLPEDLQAKVWRTDSRLQFQTDMIYLAKRAERDSDDKCLIIFAAVAMLLVAVYFALRGKLFRVVDVKTNV